ncbi:MAG: TldD/PmbA family protein [Myxococcales bacterium]|nr:TldD/PmbA family protein [Myxococcales bacterium]
MSELLQRAREAVELAHRSGASDVWASVTRDRSVSFSFRDGRMEKVKDATSRGLSLRIYLRDGGPSQVADGCRYSSHGTTDLEPARLAAFVGEAVAITRALQPDPHRTITDPALFEGRADVDLEKLDPAVAAIERDACEAWCEAMDAAAHADPRVISAECGVFTGQREVAAASSNGFSGESAGAYVGYSAQVTVREEGDRRPEAADYAYGRFLADLPAPEVVASAALRQALARIGSVKGPTARATMVVDPRAAVSLLSRALAPATAASIQQHRSFWAGKQGARLFGEKLTIVDDPLVPRGLASRLFDGEGIAARRLPIIEEGVVRNYYVDTYYGRKTGLAPTTGAPSNRLVRPGARSQAALLKEVGSGVFVTSFMGGNSDATTGDFSFGIRGHLIEGGEIGAPVGEMNVTGNLADLLSRLELVGDDPFLYSAMRVPTLVLADVQFSGS